MRQVANTLSISLSPGSDPRFLERLSTFRAMQLPLHGYEGAPATLSLAHPESIA
jgi:hypothetical protein